MTSPLGTCLKRKVAHLMQRLFIILLAFAFWPVYLILKATKRKAKQAAESIADVAYNLSPVRFVEDYQYSRRRRTYGRSYYGSRRSYRGYDPYDASNMGLGIAVGTALFTAAVSS